MMTLAAWFGIEVGGRVLGLAAWALMIAMSHSIRASATPTSSSAIRVRAAPGEDPFLG
jgi:hypothetical protein